MTRLIKFASVIVPLVLIFSLISCGKGDGPIDPRLSVINNLSATVLDKAVLLTWLAPEGVEDFKVYWGLESRKYDAPGSPGVTGQSNYVVVGLENGTTYYLAVTSFDEKSGQESNLSDEVIAIPGTDNYPRLAVYPSSLSMHCNPGGSAAEKINVDNVGGGVLNWAASKVGSASWLAFDPDKGTNLGEIAVNAACNSLAIGSYSEKIRVTAEAFGSSEVSISLAVDNKTVNPSFELSAPEPLDYSCNQGQKILGKQIYVDVSNGTVNWTASSNKNWLQLLDPASGSTDKFIKFDLDCSLLTASDAKYSGTITVNGGTAGNKTKEVLIKVNQPPILTVTLPEDPITLACEEGKQTQKKSITVSNTGAGILKYTSNPSSVQFTINPLGGELAQGQSLAHEIYVNCSGLAVGQTTGYINIVPDIGTVKSVQINVTVTAAPKPAQLSVNISPESYSCVDGQQVQSAGTMIVNNLGDGTITWNATAPGWFHLLAVTGTASAASPSTVSVMIDCALASISAGNYTGVVEVTSAGLTSVQKNVSLTVLASADTKVTPSDKITMQCIKGITWPASASFTVTNAGSGTINFTASENMQWLALDKTSGTVPPEVTITASADCQSSSLAIKPDPYVAIGYISIASPGIPPKTLKVELTVQPLTYQLPAPSAIVGSLGSLSSSTCNFKIEWLPPNNPPATINEYRLSYRFQNVDRYSGELTWGDWGTRATSSGDRAEDIPMSRDRTVDKLFEVYIQAYYMVTYKGKVYYGYGQKSDTRQLTCPSQY